MKKAGPFALRQEYLVDQALESALAMTDAQLRRLRPAASAAPLFPKRTGFSNQEPTIQDVLSMDRSMPSYRSWVSGMPVMPRILSDYSFSATPRNVNQTGPY